MKKVKLLMLFTLNSPLFALLAALFRHQLRQEEHGRAAGEHRRHDIGQRLGKHNGCCPENRRQDEHADEENTLAEHGKRQSPFDKAHAGHAVHDVSQV